MEATMQRPIYTVYIVSGKTKLNITPALASLGRADMEGQIAQRVDLQLRNIQVDGVHLSTILTACNRVYVYANDGSKNDEVFRGFLWGRNYKSSISDHLLKVTAYDHLIYMQQSEDTYYFTAGKSTKDIVAAICNDWEVKLSYEYHEFTHPKLPLRGKLYDILTADILDEVKKHTGDKYAVISIKDVMHVKLYGTNTIIYQFRAGKNVISTSSGWTMDNVVTQVTIVGQTNDNDYEPRVATVTGDTETYGTLQKVISCDDVENLLWRVKVEAQHIIDANGEPIWEYEIEAPDIPWIRKGDRVYVNAGDISNRYLYVKAVNRSYDLKNAVMTLTLEDGSAAKESPDPWTNY